MIMIMRLSEGTLSLCKYKCIYHQNTEIDFYNLLKNFGKKVNKV